jgi:ribose transport system ATP-binding protein
VSSPLLSVSELHKRYAVPVLRGANFEVEAGQVHALVGANGAGKTTLCRIICGLTQYDGGNMRVEGNSYKPESVVDAEQHGIRIVMQEPHLIDNLSVGENLYFSSLPTRRGMIDFARLFDDAREALDSIGLVGLDPRQKVGALGIGQRQLIEIARVLIRPCRILILDEPTAALTDPQIDLLFEKIAALKSQGTGIIYVSHRISEFERIADIITVLKNGKTVGTSRVSDLSPDEIVRLMAGELDQGQHGARSSTAADVAVKVRKLSSDKLLRDIDLDIRYGEILGIAGLIGAGRTELLRAIFGADKIDNGGSIRLGDETEDLKLASPEDAIAHGIGLIPEDRGRQGLLLTQSITRNVTLASIQDFRMSLGRIDDRRERAAVENYRQQLEIDCTGISQDVAELSGGNQQKVIISRWLMKDCKVLLFDEPTRGIDIQTREAIYKLLYELAAQGKAIVVVSSENRELMNICDRIAVLSNGRLAAVFARSEWSAEKIMAASFSAYTDNAAA